METVARIYEATLSDPVALLFARIITSWFVAAVILAWVPALSSTRVGARFVSITPNILATLGVLGTFTGILIGLLDFNVDNIDDSVPLLLVGLKIAFSTSIVGMSAAIVFRSLQTFAPTRTTSSGVRVTA